MAKCDYCTATLKGRRIEINDEKGRPQARAHPACFAATAICCYCLAPFPPGVKAVVTDQGEVYHTDCPRTVSPEFAIANPGIVPPKFFRQAADHPGRFPPDPNPVPLVAMYAATAAAPVVAEEVGKALKRKKGRKKNPGEAGEDDAYRAWQEAGRKWDAANIAHQQALEGGAGSEYTRRALEEASRNWREADKARGRPANNPGAKWWTLEGDRIKPKPGERVIDLMKKHAEGDLRIFDPLTIVEEGGDGQTTQLFPADLRGTTVADIESNFQSSIMTLDIYLGDPGATVNPRSGPQVSERTLYEGFYEHLAGLPEGERRRRATELAREAWAERVRRSNPRAARYFTRPPRPGYPKDGRFSNPPQVSFEKSGIIHAGHVGQFDTFVFKDVVTILSDKPTGARKKTGIVDKRQVEGLSAFIEKTTAEEGRTHLTLGILPDGEHVIGWWNQKEGFGYALNVEWPDGSEWGYGGAEYFKTDDWSQEDWDEMQAQRGRQNPATPMAASYVRAENPVGALLASAARAAAPHVAQAAGHAAGSGAKEAVKGKKNPRLPYAQGEIPQKIEKIYPWSGILANMKRQYGAREGRRIFYAWLRSVSPKMRRT